MKRPLSAFLLGLFSCSLAAHAGDLASDINNVLGDRLLTRVHTGVCVVKLGDTPGDTHAIFESSSGDALIPASNLKVVTTSAALDRLGPDFKFHTMLLSNGHDIAIVGDGDPTFGDAELLKKYGWDSLTVYRHWADVLKQAGITSAVNVRVDDSVFEQIFQSPNWPPNQGDRRYMAGVAGLNFNANCVDLTVQSRGYGQTVNMALNPPTRYVTIRNTCIDGNENAVIFSRTQGSNDIVLAGQSRGSTVVPVSVNVEDPPMFAGTVLFETLGTGGVQFSGQVVRDRSIRAAYYNSPDHGGWKVLAVHETPLTSAMARANKDSMNLYAESIGKRMAFEATHESATWGAATQLMAAFLAKTGAHTDQYHFDDCCGLSKQNNISPAAMTHVLAYDFFSRNRQTFFATLAVAGVDGTLDDRFRGSDLRGRVFAKSGFVEGVSALSGIFQAKDQQWYAFSILMNGIPAKSNSSYKPLQERIIAVVDNDVRR